MYILYGILLYLGIGALIVIYEVIRGALTYPMIMANKGRMNRIKHALASIDGLWRNATLVMFVWPIIPVGIAVRWYRMWKYRFNR